MKNLILIISILFSINVYCQEKDSIIYILPDRVEQKIFEQLEKIPNKENLYFEFLLQTLDKDKYRITYSYSENNNCNYWAFNTNRFILINNKKYSLLFDYDILFSTSKPKEIGRYGKREGTILKTHFIYDGYNIVFDKIGKSISESWGIYKKNE